MFPIRSVARSVVILTLCLLAGGWSTASCDSTDAVPSPPPTAPSPPPTPDPPPPSDGVAITGSEWLGWDQRSEDGPISGLRFVLYVDGVGSVLAHHVCEPTAGPAGHACRAPLPDLSVGSHTLELATRRRGIESPKSEALRVSRRASLRRVSAGWGFDAETGLVDSVDPIADGIEFTSAVVADDLRQPTDLAFASDGRLYVAERAGRVWVIETGGADIGERTLAIDLPGVFDDDGLGLLSVAVHPDHETNGLVYLALAVWGAEGRPALQVVRYRNVAHVLTEPRIVLEGIPLAPRGAATVRFGPDGKLYVGVSDDPNRPGAQDLSTLTGKILRLNADGVAPRSNPHVETSSGQHPETTFGAVTQPRRTPVFSRGHRMPAGLAWHPSTGQLWEIEDGEIGELNRIAAGSDYGWPDPSAIGARGPLLRFTPGERPSALAFYPPDVDPRLEGDLFVASRDSEELFRVRVTAAEPAVAVERLLYGRFGPIGSVAISPTGGVYFATARGVSDASELHPADRTGRPAGDVVGRLVRVD